MTSLVLEHEARHDQDQDEGDNGQANKEIAHHCVVFKEIESAKEIVPIMTRSVSAQKGKESGSCVSRVDAYVEKVMSQPEQGNLSARPVGMNQEMPDQQRGQQDLHQRASRYPDELPEEAKEEMPRLVNQQVGVVQQSVVVPIQDVVDAERQQYK